jgi:hypothetical protein
MATIERDNMMGHMSLMQRWYVTMYIEGKTIQKSVTLSEDDAKKLAEDFIHMGSSGGPTLLNENITNG